MVVTCTNAMTKRMEKRKTKIKKLRLDDVHRKTKMVF